MQIGRLFPVSGSRRFSPRLLAGAAVLAALLAASDTVGAQQALAVSAPAVTVVSPNGNGSLRIGNTQLITIAHTLGIGQNIAIEVSRDGGSTWSAITTLRTVNATSASYAWTVSGPPTARARIRASVALSALALDVSDVDFAIVGPSVTVTSPNGSGSMRIGSTQTVTFTHNLGLGQLVTIEATRDGGATWNQVATVTTTSPTSGAVSWLVDGPSAAHARIRASWASDPTVSDVSDLDFAIIGPLLTVTSPNGSGGVRVGATQTIQFAHNLGVGQAIALDVTRDGGASWSPIGVTTTTSPTSGAYPWVVTGPLTQQARIRATWAADTRVFDGSDVNFTILDPIAVTAPNTATTWTAGTIHPITWAHSLPASEAVKIDVSRDGGTTWSPVAASVPAGAAAAGTYAWTVSGPSTTHGRIRVSRLSNQTVSDVSDVDFTIVDATMTVTSPNGAGAILIGSTRAITFTHTLGSGQTVNLDVSRDGGSTWNLLTTVTTTNAASVSYSWLVSGPYTPRARVRARWAVNPAVADVSDYDFAIKPPRPIVADDSYIVRQGSVLSVPAPGVLANDTVSADAQAQVEFFTDPAGGWLPPPGGVGFFRTLGSSGGFVWDFSTNPNVTGTFQIYYVVHYAVGDSDVAAVTIRVDPTAASMNDDFSLGVVDARRWFVSGSTGGASMAVNNQRLEVAAGSSGSSAGVTTICSLAGDLDVQVDYTLLGDWSAGRGRSLSLRATDLGIGPSGAVQISRSTTPSLADEYVGVWLDKSTPAGTSDAAGTLRLVRTGNQLSSYYKGAGGWVLVDTGQTSVMPTRISLEFGSGDAALASGSAAAFDHLVVAAGAVVCGDRAVFMDGDKSDWTDAAAIINDPAGDGPFDTRGAYYPGEDFVKISAARDSLNLYLLLEYAAPPTGGIVLLLDTDLDASTGCNGAEFAAFVLGSEPGGHLALADFRNCTIQNSYPGAVLSLVQAGNTYMEVAIDLATLRKLSPRLAGVRLSGLAISPPPSGPPDQAGPAVFTLFGPAGDNFDDNAVNSTLWNAVVTPSGAGAVLEINQRLEMLNATPGFFYDAAQGRCRITGDFDVQVDFTLLKWAAGNASALRLAAMDLPGPVGLAGISRNGNSVEDYQLHGNSGLAADQARADTAGKLRLKRSGSTLEGYYWDGSRFVLLGTDQVGTNDTRFLLDFANVSAPSTARVAFDNFTVTAGAVICP